MQDPNNLFLCRPQLCSDLYMWLDLLRESYAVGLDRASWLVIQARELLLAKVWGLLLGPLITHNLLLLGPAASPQSREPQPQTAVFLLDT